MEIWYHNIPLDQASVSRHFSGILHTDSESGQRPSTNLLEF